MNLQSDRDEMDGWKGLVAGIAGGLAASFVMDQFQALWISTTKKYQKVMAGSGAPFGAAVWLLADDITLPAVGLAKWPTQYPVSTHVYALASHLVYGLVTETVRRAVRRAL
jgi:uncharacterized membrane protein YagU involved in acid resistance